ncbi:Gfo/Idh/MocA family protein [Microbacterium sp. NPDC055683]
MKTPRIGIVGVHGYGAQHVRRVAALQERGRVVLAATADPAAPEPGSLPAGAVHHADADAMIAAGDLDVVIVATPIHTHAVIAGAAVDAGCDVLLEKPPTATLEEFRDLLSRADARGALVQVGFQSLGSDAVPAVRALIAEGAVGEVRRYGATGIWVRTDRYFTRSPWAGRRRMAGRVVADGALTNPLAHATATALAVAGRQSEDDVAGLELELLHANDIEADDTSVARFALRDAPSLTTAVTLCGAVREEPYVEVVGTSGRLRLYYTLDLVQVERDDAPFTRLHGRRPLLENLLDARATGAPLLSPLAASGAFMRLVDGVMAAPDPRPIDAAHWSDVDDEEGRHRVVRGVEDAIRGALRAESTFTGIGAPFIC